MGGCLSGYQKCLQFYVSYYNNKRPTIIAPHSQEVCMQRLIKEFFDQKPLQINAVVYLIGTESSQMSLNYSSNDCPTDVGGFVSWNAANRKAPKKFTKWYLRHDQPYKLGAPSHLKISKHKGC